ncbi:hypothetical protein DYQ86_15915 [Acidobacteria bacterium AB60]|nr:hypothetical protein DYQ86_15915 [Acidobacteria bacterium AB60]
MIDSHDFSYDDDRHEYRNSAGIVRPSVTQALKLANVIDYSRVPPSILENARRRGSNVHRWTGEWDRYGDIDRTWIQEDEVPYFEAWLRFRRESRFVIDQIEQPMLRSVRGIEIGGTPDRVGYLGRNRFVLDIKCCRSRHYGWGLQVALYEMMLTGRARLGHLGRLIVQLFPTGNYSAFPLEAHDDAPAALAALTLATTEDRFEADEALLTLNAWKWNRGIATA